jgi:hypothetical protein
MIVDLTDTSWWWLGYIIFFIFMIGLFRVGIILDRVICAFIDAVQQELAERRADNSNKNKRC